MKMLSKTALFSLFILCFSLNVFSQNWEEIQKVTSEFREDDAKFGYSVDISGDFSVVGTFAEDTDENGENSLTNSGAAYIYQFNEGSWEVVQKIVPSIRSENSFFGNSVSISDDYIIVGAYTEGYDETGENFLNSAGAAYIFEKNIDGDWVETQKILASDREDFNYYGSDVSIDGDYVVVGAPNNGYDLNGNNFMLNSGACYVYERDNLSGDWEFVKKLIAADRFNQDFFGAAVAISGDHVLVGARQEDEDESGNSTIGNSGSAYVFGRDNFGIWFQNQKIVAPDRSLEDWFGISVDIDGERLIVGARQEDDDSEGVSLPNAGSAYIFDLNDSDDWINTQKITPSDREAGDLFGFDVSVDGDRVLVSSRSESEDENGENYADRAGSAYLFEIDFTETWNEVQKLVASDRQAEDFLGTSVVIKDSFICLGARGEDHDLDGGDEFDDSGAIYFYTTCEVATNNETIQICFGDSILINGNFVYDADIYMDTLNTVLGCDSIVTKTLLVDPYTNETFEVDLCDGETIEINSTIVSEAGEYNFEETNENNCIVSEETYIVTLVPIIYESEEFTICEGEGIFIDGDFVTEAGEYEVIYNPSSLGCDSIFTTILNVNPNIIIEDYLSACSGDSILYNETYYFENIFFEENFEASTGCDSTMLTTLNFIESISEDLSFDLCEGETVMVNGEVFDEAGEYTQVIVSEAGCDSLITTITIGIDALPVIDLGADITICDTITYFLDAGAGFAGYDWSTGSDEQTILIEETDTYEVTVTDNNGCVNSDSVAITVEICIGIEEVLAAELEIYPVPVIDNLTIDWGQNTISTIKMYDLLGKLVYSAQPNQGMITLDMSSFEMGEYILEIGNGGVQITRAIIKE